MNSQSVLDIFKEITKVPRESGHEEKIIKFLQDFASEHGLACKTDQAGNVLISKPAAKGKENVPALVLQSHSDMVCEKNSGVDHDFTKDPIRYIVKDGWMIAPDTTLGADCGIGIAAELALLVSEDVKCGPLECLFTVSEETGLDGAMALKPDFISGKTLINLDSEDEGEIFVGCAGGLDTTAKFSYEEEPVKAGSVCARISVSKAMGGHSGDDINKGRANAVKLLARYLYDVLDEDWQLVSIDGGNKRNAIAREANAVIAAPAAVLARMKATFGEYREAIAEQYGRIETEIAVGFEDTARAESAICEKTRRALVTALAACPHGVLAMSQEIENFVETSTNLASVKMAEPGVIRIGSSQRSCVTASRRAAGQAVEAVFRLAGADVAHESEYPGWAPAAVSPIKDACVESYRKLFGVDPKVKAIHAGLECGLFTEKWPDLDMVSFGPTLRGVHAPGEKLDLASLDKFVALLIDVVENFK